MIELLEALAATEVRFLLISGQATVVYGAAEFTEDVDLWVDPGQSNLDLLLATLSSLNAEVGRLTPTVTEGLARAGHGFHFEVPESSGNVWSLDVMGQPPRVGAFGPALRAGEALVHTIPALRVVDPARLVERKKTDRERDYPIIGALVERMAEQWEEEDAIDRDRMEWICMEARSLPPLLRLVPRKDFQEVVCGVDRPCIKAIRDHLRRDSDLPDDIIDKFREALDDEKRQYQRHDRTYWRRIRDEVRELRRRGELLKRGQPVRDLIDSA